MNFNIKLITDWRFLVPASIALLSLAWSVFNFVVGKLTITRITQNDLKHITADIKKLEDTDKNLEKEHKEIKIDLKQDLNKIFRRLGKIDKAVAVRDAICDERHSKDK